MVNTINYDNGNTKLRWFPVSLFWLILGSSLIMMDVIFFLMGDVDNHITMNVKDIIEWILFWIWNIWNQHKNFMFHHTNIYKIQDIWMVKYFYDNQDISLILGICVRTKGTFDFWFNSQSISKFLNDRQKQKWCMQNISAM